MKVRYAGKVQEVTVLRRFKNGKVKVQVNPARNFGRPGSLGKAEVVTVEPWQIVEDDES